MREAMFYEKLADDKVKCHLCNHFCTIAPDKRGICSVRENRKGVLYSLVYGRVIARGALQSRVWQGHRKWRRSDREEATIQLPSWH